MCPGWASPSPVPSAPGTGAMRAAGSSLSPASGDPGQREGRAGAPLRALSWKSTLPRMGPALSQPNHGASEAGAGRGCQLFLN